MQYSFNNSRKIPKLAQFIPGIYNNFYYKILGYFWGVSISIGFHGLTGCQRDPQDRSVTAWYQNLSIRIRRELGCGVHTHGPN